MTSGGPDKTGSTIAKRREGINRCLPLFFFLGVLICANAVRAESTLSINADAQLGLAESFFDRADYQQAIGEYQKFLYFFPNDERALCAEYKIALAWFNDGRYEKALDGFAIIAAKHISDGPIDGMPLEARFMVSRCYLAMKALLPAEENLEDLLDVGHGNDDSDWLHDRVQYEIAWLHLEGKAGLASADIGRAAAYFNNISREYKDYARFEEISAALDSARFDQDGLLASRKNPALAGCLAILPGAGYAYCGRFHDAATAFLFNAAMMCAAWEAFDEGHDALGAVVSFVELGFYTGSIYGSITAAHKYNRNRTRVFLKQLEPLRVSFSPVVEKGGVLCCLQASF